jgi:histidinol dehydrogenase
MLKKMGARIEGEGTAVIRIVGVGELNPCSWDVIEDRIEAGTFLAACGMTRGSIVLENCVPEHIKAVIDKLTETGMEIHCDGRTIKASMSKRRPLAVDIRTVPYPGFPTDMQAQLMASMTTSKGVSAITETIFENRMMHAAELRRMGADIRVVGNTAIVHGVESISGAKVMATDLRASASLIIAGLAAYGKTEVSRIYHIDRGYERIEEKLKNLGARIERVKDEIWELDREFDGLISFVKTGREGKKRDVREAVSKIREAVLSRGDNALMDFSVAWDRWDKEYPLRLTAGEIDEAASRVSRKDLSVLKGWSGTCFLPQGTEDAEEGLQKEGSCRRGRPGTGGERHGLRPRRNGVVSVVPDHGSAAGTDSRREKDLRGHPRTGRCHQQPCGRGSEASRYRRDIPHRRGAGGIRFCLRNRSVPKVDMIVGPGNAYVEEAKRDVYGSVGIDMLAGPTELVILCTEAHSPKTVALDMFSQAEHDELASVGFFSPSREHLDDVMKSIEGLLDSAPRRETIRRALDDNGYMVHYTDLSRAVEAINSIAPEHMELVGDESCLPSILYPGVIYVGPNTPVAMGDYYIGTNHVLPTAGAGRFTGGLSVDRFTKRKVVVTIDRTFIERYGDSAERLARIEGLPAHGDAIKARKESPL